MATSRFSRSTSAWCSRVVGSGDLDAFQDVWLPNYAQLLSEVEDNVIQLGNWYQGETEFGIGVPTYMTNVNSITDLN